MATNTDIQKMYIAYFGRAADVSGLAYWTQQITDAGGNPSAVINAFSASAEYADNYAGKSNEFIVNSLYNNLFGRDAEVDGLLYWTAKLNDGTFNVGNVAWAIMVGAQNEDVIALTNKGTAAQAFTDAMDTTDEILGYTGTDAAAAAKAWLATVTDAEATLTAAVAGVDTAVANTVAASDVNVGQTFTLTAAANVLTGTNGNDTFNGTDVTSVLGSLNGGTGTDTFNYIDTTGAEDVIADTGLLLTSIETLNIRSIGAAEATTTSVTGLNNLNVTQATSVDVTAAATTAVSVSGATTTIDIDGGSTQTVTSSGNGAVTLLNAAGAVSVTHSDMQADIIVTDGTNVSVTVTASDAAGDIIVGDIDNAATNDATKQASGTVVVTATNNTTGATANANLDATMSNIYVDGGSTITVTQATSATDAATNTTGGTVTQGDVLITAGATTTTVSVSQTATVAEAPYVAAIAAVSATSTVTFGLMAAAGDSVTVNNLTFTAAKALTAAEVAAAFANLSLADLQASGGIVENGIFTGISNTTPWTSGAATGASVTFSAVAGTATPLLASTGTAVIPTATAATAGTAAGAVTEGVLGVATGTVNILDTAATATITTVTVDGYKTGSSIGVDGAGETQKANALTTLSLANSDAAAGFAVATASTSLDLTVNNVNGTLNLDATGTDGAAITNTVVATLDVTTATAASTIALQADAVVDLTVAGTQLLTLTSSSLDALETVVVSGTAGLTLAGQDQTVLTSITTTATTGTVTATIDADIATYTGGAGVDNVTLSTTTVDKAVNLGAGNNSLTLAAGTTALTSEMIAGAGTDTLVMAAADAETASGATTFETKITGFERLSLGVVATTADNTINLANMDDISYVISANTFDTAQVTTNTVTCTTQLANANTDTASITVDGVVYTTAALTASGVDTASDAAVIAAALDVVLSAAGYNVAAVGAVLTFTATAGTMIDSGSVSVTGTGVATSVDVITSSELFLTNMTNNGTLQLTAAGLGATVTMTDATSLTADILNVIVTNTAGINAGTVAAAGVETVNITVTDTTTTAIGTHTLVLSDAAVKTINIDGNAGLTLTTTGATALTSVDASDMTAALTLTANGAAAGTTVTGGSGADALTASGSSDVLLGGAGADTLTGANLTTLTGGAGNDTFVMNMPVNVNSYSTITDLSSGDVIDFGSTKTFVSSAIVLGDTAVFQDFANTAINQLVADGDDVAWFQYNNNTYIVQNGAGDAVADFINGEDSIIKISGLVDLDTGASYNQSTATLEIV